MHAVSHLFWRALGGPLLLGVCALAAVPGTVVAEAGSPNCTLFASPSGKNNARGTARAPLRTIRALITRLRAGQIGCLAAGQTFNESVTLRGGETHGAEGSPVTLTSTDPRDPALISGAVATEKGADWITFTHLRFKSLNRGGLPSMIVASRHTSWTYDDVTAPATICFNLVRNSYGVAEDTLIEHSRIHGCGSQEKFACNQNTRFCETPPNDGFFLHGIYVAGATQTTIRNDYIYENADRGVQVRAGSRGVLVEHSIFDDNGEGLIYGEGATHVTAQWNIITDSHSPCGEASGCYDYAASEYEAAAADAFANNDVYGNQCANPKPACYPNRGNIERMNRVTVGRNLEVDPLYLDAAARSYTLRPNSPVLGYGPDTAQPAP